MEETIKQGQALEGQLAELARANAGKEKTMEDHFNDRYLAILNKEGEQPEKLAELKTTANASSKDINDLLTKRQEKVELEQNIAKMQELMRAVNENDTRTTGRKYFQDLVGANQANYDFLLKVNPEKGGDLETLRKNINQESGGLKSGAMYVGSWLTSPLALVSRNMPKVLKDTVSGFVPDTNDSLAKRQLSEMTQSTLENMKAQLKTKNEEISTLESRLAGGNEKLQKQIEDASPEDLQKIVAVNSIAVAMVDEYNKVKAPVDAIGQKLKNIEHLDKNIK